MTRQNISTGTTANDGTGDVPRDAATKINQTFVEIYQHLGGDSNTLSSRISFDSDKIVFEGSSLDSYETNLIVVNPTADRTIQIPNDTGILVLDGGTQTLTNKTLTSPVLTTPQINDTSLDHQYVVAVGELVADRNVNLPILTDSDTFVFEDHTQTLINKTLTSPNITTPAITTSINDANGAESIDVLAVASAVNHIEVANAATGSNPSITGHGDDANIGINLAGKGAGEINIKTKFAYTSETLTGATPAVSLLVPFTIFNRGTAITATMADGTVTGESKRFVNIGAGATTVTPSNFGQGTSFSMIQHGSVEAIWAGSNWYLVGFDSSDTHYITTT